MSAPFMSKKNELYNKIYETKAYCSSSRCAGSASVKKYGEIKNVSKYETICPDCGQYLIFRNELKIENKNI